MKYIAWLILAVLSMGASRLLLSFMSPNDPEGTNLLVTAAVATLIFVPLLLAYFLVLRLRR